MENETKYIVKAYDYDGNFYGYAAKHPEEDDMPYYDDDKAKAIRFDSYEDAYCWVNKYEDTSELESTIIIDSNDTNKNRQQKIRDIIEAFVEENYGANELNNPSWDIESLAFDIDKELE